MVQVPNHDESTQNRDQDSKYPTILQSPRMPHSHTPPTQDETGELSSQPYVVFVRGWARVWPGTVLSSVIPRNPKNCQTTLHQPYITRPQVTSYQLSAYLLTTLATLHTLCLGTLQPQWRTDILRLPKGAWAPQSGRIGPQLPMIPDRPPDSL